MADKKRILVVDNEPTMVALLATILDEAGYEVMEALDGETALVKAKSEQPDLIVSDLMMPGIDGFELFKRLKADTATAQIPVMIVTARKKMGDSFASLGAAEFIAKPYFAQDILNKVAKVVEVVVPPVLPVVAPETAPLPEPPPLDEPPSEAVIVHEKPIKVQKQINDIGKIVLWIFGLGIIFLLVFIGASLIGAASKGELNRPSQQVIE